MQGKAVSEDASLPLPATSFTPPAVRFGFIDKAAGAYTFLEWAKVRL